MKDSRAFVSSNKSLKFKPTFFQPYVKDVIHRYLDCGDLHNGFARIKCPDCKHEYLLPFSCKRRHFCPTCHQKRVIVFGVALDFCVYYVVKGLRKYSDIRLYVVKDAVKGLGIRPEQEIFDEFRRIGVEITELDALVRRV